MVFKSIKRTHYADFNGRARREEFWMFQLFNFLAIIVIMIVFGGIAALLETPSILFISYIYILGIIIPSLALAVRRIHDTGKSGWFYLVSLIPLVGSIWLLVIYYTDSQNGTNKWGDNPKGTGNNATIDQIGKE
ncbi:DUF805 domain-containing protein [Polaribacter sp. L3A8]|uniref:DUF805 domain-containing protein n=1 Tax=Polaribacter sp. L3A8 TaxID=2686361 RepID=UPI001E5E7C2B|nr:DUF805 domain-containing protein [Polaribacter sp. L3A8]